MTPQEIAKYLNYADPNIELVVITKEQFNILVKKANKYRKIIKIIKGRDTNEERTNSFSRTTRPKW